MTLIVGSVIGVGMADQRPSRCGDTGRPAAIRSLADIAGIVAGKASTSVIRGAGAAG